MLKSLLKSSFDCRVSFRMFNLNVDLPRYRVLLEKSTSLKCKIPAEVRKYPDISQTFCSEKTGV